MQAALRVFAGLGIGALLLVTAYAATPWAYPPTPTSDAVDTWHCDDRPLGISGKHKIEGGLI